jgi:hypothetical protein
MGNPIYENDEQRAKARKEINARYYQKTKEIRLQKQKEYDAANKQEINRKRKEKKYLAKQNE